MTHTTILRWVQRYLRNVAVRLAATAAPGQVLVSEDVRAGEANGSSFEHLGEVKLKGREQKLNIYSVEDGMKPLVTFRAFDSKPDPTNLGFGGSTTC